MRGRRIKTIGKRVTAFVLIMALALIPASYASAAEDLTSSALKPRMDEESPGIFYFDAPIPFDTQGEGGYYDPCSYHVELFKDCGWFEDFGEVTVSRYTNRPEWSDEKSCYMVDARYLMDMEDPVDPVRSMGGDGKYYIKVTATRYEDDQSVTAQSPVYSFTQASKKLDQVTGVRWLEGTNTATWNAVDNAAGYVVTMLYEYSENEIGGVDGRIVTNNDFKKYWEECDLSTEVGNAPEGAVCRLSVAAYSADLKNFRHSDPSTEVEHIAVPQDEIRYPDNVRFMTSQPGWLVYDGNFTAGVDDMGFGRLKAEIFKKGNSKDVLVGTEEVTAKSYNEGTYHGTVNMSQFINEAGDYYATLTEYEEPWSTDHNYEDNNKLPVVIQIKTPVYTYHRPSSSLGSPKNLKWSTDGSQTITWKISGGKEYFDCYTYTLQDKDGRQFHDIFFELYDLKFDDTSYQVREGMGTESQWKFGIRAVSANIEKRANSDLVFSPAFGATAGELEELKDILAGIGDATPSDAVKDIKDSLDRLSPDKLKAAMEDDEILSGIRDLEDRYNQERDITVATPSVSEPVREIVNADSIEIIGAGFSADEGGQVHLDIATPSNPDRYDVSGYENSVLIDIKLRGVRNQENLSMPVTIIMDAPKGVDIENGFKILHFRNGETEPEVITPKLREDGRIQFTVTSFSVFAFVDTKGGTKPVEPPVKPANPTHGSRSGGSGSISRPAGAWVQDSVGWWYKNADGTWPSDCWMYLEYNKKMDWYHFNREGYLDTGWYTDKDGKKYYLNPAADGTRGAMATGWRLIDGKWYYFNPISDGTKGSLLANTTTPDGYGVGADGAWDGRKDE